MTTISVAMSNAAYTMYREPTLVQVGYKQPASVWMADTKPTTATGTQNRRKVFVNSLPMSMIMETLAM
jgi:hypothetical protein